MKITNFNPDGIPLALGGWSTGAISLNSNVDIVGGGPSALYFVQRITSNTSNTLLNPIVNFASGSGVTFSASSNTLTISSSAGGGATTAAQVSIADVGNYFTASEVESALQELASKDIGYQAHGNTGATETFSSLIGWHSATLDNNCTFTFTGATSGLLAGMVLELAQDGTGSRLVTWPGSVVWPGGVAPTLSTAAASVDVLTFFSRDGGTTWYGFPTGGGASVSYATPAIVLGTAAAAGAASTVIRSDSTIVAFDATVPVTQAFSDAAATGSAAVAARRDHVHGMPATPTTGGSVDHEHIVNVVFSGDGATTVWELPAAPVDSTSVSVYVTASRSIAWALSGTMLTTLTFDSAPANASNNIVIDIVAAVA